MPYTVPKLTDFSAAPLDCAVRELWSALEQEAASRAALAQRVTDSTAEIQRLQTDLAFLRKQRKPD